MNFIFISPHFPDHYYRFCAALKKNGCKVFGIDDVPYDQLDPKVKQSLDEYYYVHSLENYEEKYRAVAYFISKYGRIDFIESNNEYWLESDAKLREDFNIKSGPQTEQIRYFRHKSAMKEKYALAGVKTARYQLMNSPEDAYNFVQKVGYPIIAKPDDGVGSSATFRLSNKEQLDSFIEKHQKEFPNHLYILEEFIDGELISLDGVCDNTGKIVFPSHHVFPLPVMDIVVEYTDVYFYTSKSIPQDLLDAAQAILYAFETKSRFFHFEFFRLTKDSSLGKKGDIYGLEVNMRTPGGYIPDMIDFAYGTDIFQVWADTICFNENRHVSNYPKHHCAYIGRRNDGKYAHSLETIKKRYAPNYKWDFVNPGILADGMGDYFLMANFDTIDEVNEFFSYCLERITPSEFKKM